MSTHRKSFAVMIGARRFAAAGLLLALLLASGCGITEKRKGPVMHRIIGTRVETRTAPVPNWPVWVFVNGNQVGAYRTNTNGEVAVDFRPYIPAAAQGSGLNIEFRYRQPDGKVERKWHRLTAQQLQSQPR